MPFIPVIPVINVSGVRKTYGQTVAVDEVSFDVADGEIFGLIGPNGAGKTTTMECVEGLRSPDRGTISVLGLNPFRDVYKLQNRIGVQLQQAQLQKRIKVWEAIHLWASLYPKSVDGDRLLEQLGLGEKRNAWFMTLSGGQKQRLFIALALINDPELVFLDELTTGLDPQARRAIWDLVRGIRERGKTVFLTTHLMEEAERFCDRVAIIDYGRIIDIDTPDDLCTGTARSERSCWRQKTPTADARFRRLPRVDTVICQDGHFTIRGRGDDLVTDVIHCLSENRHPRHRFPHRHSDSRRRLSQVDRSFDSRLRRPVAMLRGLWNLTWLEIKIFLREPLGASPRSESRRWFLSCSVGCWVARPPSQARGLIRVELPVLASILIAINAVLSLVTIISIYREGGILKRLRATPLRPHTILAAHVIVKLLLTAVTLTSMVLAGKRYYPLGVDAPVIGFTVALLLTTLSILSMGFLIASLIPTARFAQPIGAMILYPMIGFSGLFGRIDALPPVLQAVARVQPLTYAVSLLQGIWKGDAWSAHVGDLAALALLFAVCTAKRSASAARSPTCADHASPFQIPWRRSA